MIYFFVIFVLLVLIFIYDYMGIKTAKTLCYNVMLMVLVSIAGFRYRLGIDTVVYEEMYHYIPVISEWTVNNIFEEPITDIGYMIFVSIFKTLFGSWEVVQFFIALFINVVVFRFLKKNVLYPFAAILFYFISVYYDMNFETLRQAMAVCCFLCGYSYMKERKYIHYYLYVLLAISFHKVALIALLFPFVQYLRFNFIALICCCVSFFLVGYLNSRFSDFAVIFQSLYLDSVSDKIMVYAESEKYGGLVFRSIVNFINIAIVRILPIYVLSVIDYKYNNKISNQHSAMLLLYVFASTMSVSVFIFYRVMQFFTLFAIVYFVNVLSVFQKHDVRKNVLIVYCVLMFAYSSLPRFWRISDETGLPFYVRIYPYADVFTKEVDINRENEYSAYGR